jgi:hypothetical protein
MVRDVARTDPFSQSHSSLGTHRAHTFRKFKWSCIVLNHRNTPVQLLRCLSLFSSLIESTSPPAAQLLLSQARQGDLVGYHLRLSNVFERISRSRREPLYATNTSNRKQEINFCECPLHWGFCQQKTWRGTLLFDSTLLKQGRYFNYWNQPLNLRMCACYLDCHEAGLCLPNNTQKNVYVHISCFTSICDLFTDSLSYTDFIY